MKRDRLMKLREMTAESIVAHFESLNNPSQGSRVDGNFVSLMINVHAMCCRHLESEGHGWLGVGERAEISHVADSLELLVGGTSAEFDFLKVTIEELRVIAARGGVS